jgi:hypothetical protein
MQLRILQDPSVTHAHIRGEFAMRRDTPIQFRTPSTLQNKRKRQGNFDNVVHAEEQMDHGHFRPTQDELSCTVNAGLVFSA